MEDTEVRELTRTYLHMFNKLITQPTVGMIFFATYDLLMICLGLCSQLTIVFVLM
jgi:hypothetical protein